MAIIMNSSKQSMVVSKVQTYPFLKSKQGCNKNHKFNEFENPESHFGNERKTIVNYVRLNSNVDIPGKP